MAIIFKDKIQLVDINVPAATYLRELPDKCPICPYAISPEYILTYEKDKFTLELLCGCSLQYMRGVVVQI
ncbi:hypothetical protein ACFWGC_27575 [Cytobacillus pseudoceanisediminis]|uniref:hypothetical protein n=1 Tax=Cytobacillus TaxID=2675230 RepID=UPI0020C849CD|nr:hypothetical protein [Cytobacillus oceanisediminis]